jgi:dihydropteroate synthase
MAASSMQWGRFSLGFDQRPLVMGVINVTPDSFSDGGDHFDPQVASARGLAMIEEGADLIDVGGESTRPGADEVGLDRELDRVLPVIEALAEKVAVPISIDTYKAEVAHRAVKAGASIINDVSAGRFDPEIFAVAAETGVPVVLMHMKGQPRNMQKNPAYDDLTGEVKEFLADAVQRAVEAGVDREKTIVDPGIGFGKTFDHNLTLINRLREFQDLDRPILVGLSRKAFLGRILGGPDQPAPPKKREAGSLAGAVLAAYNGANILRVHRIRDAREALTVVGAVMNEHV